MFVWGLCAMGGMEGCGGGGEGCEGRYLGIIVGLRLERRLGFCFGGSC